MEFLFLVNGQDDNRNGFIDEGFDGVDNDCDGVIDDLGEWEVETWTSATMADVDLQPPLHDRPRGRCPRRATARWRCRRAW